MLFLLLGTETVLTRQVQEFAISLKLDHGLVVSMVS